MLSKKLIIISCYDCPDFVSKDGPQFFIFEGTPSDYCYRFEKTIIDPGKIPEFCKLEDA